MLPSVKVPIKATVGASTDMASVEVVPASETLRVVAGIEAASVNTLTGAARRGVGAMALTHPVLVLVMRVDIADAGGSAGGLLAVPWFTGFKLNDPAGQRHWHWQELPLLAIGVPITIPPV